MVRRNTDSIEHLESVDEGKPVTQQKLTRMEPSALIEINYPEPTSLSIIIRDVSRWSGHSFVMEPNTNTRIQIFAPHKMSYNDAWTLFLASLSVVNLRAVQMGKIVKIVASQTVIAV